MGEVYRAKDVRLEREVAIKVLPDHLARNPDASARFEREAQAVAALSHPNILAIHEFGVEEDLRYAVMELLEGENLRDRLNRTALAWQEAVEIGVAVADGLAAAHLKASFIGTLSQRTFFSPTKGNQNSRLRFGDQKNAAANSARASAPQPQAATARVDGSGTVGYVSPERVIVPGKSGCRSDIFSLGCVLYEMAAGTRAFERPTSTGTLNAILKEEPSEPSALNKTVPPKLGRAILRCLEKEPAARYQSAGIVGGPGRPAEGRRIAATCVRSCLRPR